MSTARRRVRATGVTTRVIRSVLAHLREKLNGVRERELAAALKRLPDLTPAQRTAVERLSRSLMSGFLHEPSVRLRAAASNGHDPAVVDAARYLFALDEHHEEERTAPSGGSRAA